MLFTVAELPAKRQSTSSIDNAGIVIFQFRCSSLNIVPVNLLRYQDTATDNRQTKVPGKLILGPKQDCALFDLPFDLLRSSYRLVDGFWEMRHKDCGTEFYVVRFTFAQRKPDDPSDPAFAENKEDILNAFIKMIAGAYWSLQVFRNPLFRDGEIIKGKCSISINLANRKPTVKANGSPVVAWKRDPSGNKLGDQPVPITPLHNAMMLELQLYLCTNPLEDSADRCVSHCLNISNQDDAIRKFRRIRLMKAQMDQERLAEETAS